MDFAHSSLKLGNVIKGAHKSVYNVMVFVIST